MRAPILRRSILFLVLISSCVVTHDRPISNSPLSLLQRLKPYGLVPISAADAQRIFDEEGISTSNVPYYRADRTVASNGVEWNDAQHRCFMSFEPSQDAPQVLETLRLGCRAGTKEAAVEIAKSWLSAIDERLPVEFDNSTNEPDTLAREVRKILRVSESSRSVSIEVRVFKSRDWNNLLVIHPGEPLIYGHEP